MEALNTILQQSHSNVNVKTETNLNNVNVKKSISEVRNLAQQLCDKLAAQDNFQYYCKVAWHLSEAQIWQNYEASLYARSPCAVFYRICEEGMKKAP
jgi:hypothetical protein